MANTLRELIAELDANNVTGAQRYNQVRRFISFKGRKSRTPVEGSFELTPLCNLDCKMCYVHLSKGQMKGIELLPLETWISIAQQAIDAGMLYAQITGGECLTYPGFKEFYLFLRSHGIETTIKSNGILIEGEMLEFFKKNPPSLISITVYGASEDGYEAVTGHRSFNRVIKNIEEIQKADIPVSISVTPNKFMNDGKEVLHLLHKHGLHWNINPLLISPFEETGRKIEEASLETYAGILKESCMLLNQELCLQCLEDDLPEAGNATGTSGTIRCAAGKSSFAINWKGELSPCINFPSMRFSLLDSSFKEVWKIIGEELNTYPTPMECNGCAYEKACPNCVAAHNDAPKGHASKRICNLTKFLVKEGLLALD